MEKSPKINIIYEDNHLLVIEKPVGIPVQADSSNAIDLITLLKEYRIKKENKKGDAYIGLVHRLDRPVGGIMVFVWKFLIAPIGGVFGIYELLPAFLCALIAIVVVSLLTKAPEQEIVDEFEAVSAEMKQK